MVLICAGAALVGASSIIYDRAPGPHQAPAARALLWLGGEPAGGGGSGSGTAPNPLLGNVLVVAAQVGGWVGVPVGWRPTGQHPDACDSMPGRSMQAAGPCARDCTAPAMCCLPLLTAPPPPLPFTRPRSSSPPASL